MALPGNFSTVPVHGKYLDLAGVALAGTVTFTATPDALTDPAALIIIMRKPLVVTLDVNGEFTTNLPATDDPDIDPIGFTYKVVESFPGRDVDGREYYITVPVASLPGGIDLTTAAPAIPVDGVARGQFLTDLGDVDTTGAVTDSPLVRDSTGEWVAGPALSATYAPYTVTNARNPLTGWYHVEQYGALGNSNGTTGNGTNDYTAIQAAVTAAGVAGGGRVYASHGIFRITQQLKILYSNVSLVGAGPGVTTIFADHALNHPSILASSGQDDNTALVVPATALTDITIRDLTVKGLYTAPFSNDVQLVNLWGVHGGLVDNVEAWNSSGMGIVVVGGSDGVVACQDIIVRGCNVHDARADGIHVSMNSHNVIIEGNNISNTDDDGIGIGSETPESGDIIVRGNTIRNSGSRGVAVMGPVLNVSILGNTITNTWLSGININCWTGNAAVINIRDNQVYNAGMGTSGNVRNSGYSCGIYVNTSSTGGSFGIYGVSITDNTILLPRNSFIVVGRQDGGPLVAGATAIQINGNHCRSIAAHGAGGTGSGGGTNNAPSGGKYPGIWVQDTHDVVVQDNFVTYSYEDAIRADLNNDGLTRISENTFIDCNQSAAGSIYGAYNNNGKVVLSNNIARDPSSHLAGVVTTVGGTLVQAADNALTT